MNRWNAFLQLVLSRFREFFREPHAIFWVYGFPLLLAVILGVAFASSKPQPPTVDVQGVASDPAVADLVNALEAANVKVEVHPESESRKRLRGSLTSLVIVPGRPPDKAGPTYVYDEARSESLLARHWVDAVLTRAQGKAPLAVDDPVDERGSRYIDLLLPGLMGMNLMGGGLFGVGFLLVDMRVRKLLKRLLATPMRRSDFLIAIFASRLVFLLPEQLALLLLGRFVFNVPIAGNPLLLLLVLLVGAAAFDAIGLLLASRTEKIETISGLVNLVMLPMYLVSGTFFPSRRFGEAAQPFIQALPLTQVNDALREVMLEGKGLDDMGWRLGVLAAWAVVCFTVGLRWFRWR